MHISETTNLISSIIMEQKQNINKSSLVCYTCFEIIYSGARLLRTLVLVLTSYMTLNNLFNCSVLQFPCLEVEDNNIFRSCCEN